MPGIGIRRKFLRKYAGKDSKFVAELARLWRSVKPKSQEFGEPSTYGSLKYDFPFQRMPQQLEEAPHAGKLAKR